MLFYDLGSLEEWTPPLFFTSMEGLHHTGPVLSGCLLDYNADPVAQANGASVG